MLLHGLRVSRITAMSFLNYLETFPHPHLPPLRKYHKLHALVVGRSIILDPPQELPSPTTQDPLTSQAFMHTCNQELIRVASKSTGKVEETKVSSGEQSFPTTASSRWNAGPAGVGLGQHCWGSGVSNACSVAGTNFQARSSIQAFPVAEKTIF